MKVERSNSDAKQGKEMVRFFEKMGKLPVNDTPDSLCPARDLDSLREDAVTNEATEETLFQVPYIL